jgi:peptide-methionine (R)-S-oxide reductase
VWSAGFPRYDKSDSATLDAAFGSPSKRAAASGDLIFAGECQGVIPVPMIKKTESEWKKQLSPNAFEVTRHAATEPPFTGENLNVHDKGVFRCVCCDAPLFSSDTKFDSGTGWPSFWAPIDNENVVEETDVTHGMARTEVKCGQCEAHLGHVFPDGPKPTGQRYCMNSVALRFAKGT